MTVLMEAQTVSAVYSHIATVLLLFYPAEVKFDLHISRFRHLLRHILQHLLQHLLQHIPSHEGQGWSGSPGPTCAPAAEVPQALSRIFFVSARMPTWQECWNSRSKWEPIIPEQREADKRGRDILAVARKYHCQQHVRERQQGRAMQLDRVDWRLNKKEVRLGIS